MPSSVKRERYSALEHRSPEKKPRLYYLPRSLSPINSHRVVLNPADCDLDFDIEGNGLQGSALYEHGFAYCWSGTRANVGITGGKYCFSCKIVSGQPVDMDDTPIGQKHLCRIGISTVDDKVGNLGETEHSFGFGGTGKFSNSGKFSTYGESFDIGDTILCAVDLESGPMGSIGFAKNGKWLGTASRLVNGGPAVFPHVLLKNVVVQLQFSYEDGLVPQDGYRPWSCAFADGNGLMGPSFSDERNCELIMMVGLPASGKTTWAERWVNDHPEKRYILLGTNLVLDQMKVPGLLRKQNYGERFDRLMDRATAIFNTLLARASKRPCNLIIDQTNVYKSARKRKLAPFTNFQKIAVVAFSRPEDLKARSEQRCRETGKEVPAEAINKMIANFVLPGNKDMPGTDECFDQVIYIELNMTESKKCLDEMKAKLQSGLTYHHPLESPTHLCHPTSGHSDTSKLQYRTIPSGGHLQDRILSRDDLNHRRSYNGYEHRAVAPVAMSNFYQRNSSNHTPTNENMDLSPQYTANANYHAAPVERYTTTSSSSLYGAYGGPSFVPQVDMHTPFLSPVTSIPHGSIYGAPDPMKSYGHNTSHAPNYNQYQPRSSYYY
ncbi:putative heterogeneous nuclear ribonucleoprotein U, SPRY [Helianthus annuus]|nr:putative heterogeneous nuclear ribonucleoprotein U, SPRY [Helianthus annuus]